MAHVHRLPNGMIVLVLTGREAALLMDQILDPGDFPWHETESQMVGFEVKARLRNMLFTDVAQHLAVSHEALMAAAERTAREEEGNGGQEEGRPDRLVDDVGSGDEVDATGDDASDERVPRPQQEDRDFGKEIVGLLRRTLGRLWRVLPASEGNVHEVRRPRAGLPVPRRR